MCTRTLLLLLSLSLAGPLLAQEKAGTQLGATTAEVTDERFAFRVSYSAVSVDAEGFKATMTLLHRDGANSHQVVQRINLPLATLRAAERAVLEEKAPLKAAMVRLTLPKGTPAATVKVSTTTVQDGKTETDGWDGDGIVDLYFANLQAAQAWNDELARFLATK